MSKLLSALNWYQKKIGAYDKQLWEKTVDQRILRGVCAVPKKLARIKTELIDVDLVRGSAFPKAKPQHSWIAATLSGVLRVLFLPFYFTWWKLQTNTLVSSTLVLLYILQIVSVFLFYSASETDFSDVPSSEALTPAAMMLILGILHSQIVATFSSKSSHKRVTRTKRKRLKRKMKVRASLDYDTKSSPETASEGRANSDKCCGQSSEAYDCHHCHHSADFHSSPEQNRKDHPDSQTHFSKKLSDDESGLDVMDSIHTVDKEPFNKCKIHHDSGCVVESINSSCKHCHCSNKQLSTEQIMNHPNHFTSSKSNIKMANNSNDIDTENISSGEEYFVAKKPLLNIDEWKNYILELKHNVNNKKHIYIRRNYPKTSGQVPPRRFSDLGPIADSTASKEQFGKRCSEDSLLSSFTDPCQTNKLKEMIKLRNAKNGHSKLDSFPNGLKCRKPFQHPLQLPMDVERCYSSGDSGPDTTSPNTPLKLQTSDLEWPLITNTDCNSDSSDSTSQSSHDAETDASQYENPFAWEIQENTPSYGGCPSSDKGSQTRTVSCTIWERNECKKVDLSVLDISSAIIRKVDSSVHSTEYLAMGLLFATVIAFLPLLFRLQSGTSIDTIQDVTMDVINFTVPSTDYVMQVWHDIVAVMIGSEWRVKSVVLIAMAERFALSLAYFFLLSVAEKTFKQRFLYAKHFSYLTSSRRARRSDLPHFRLNKVRNIKTWLSVRSYLKKLGPQRSVDVTVSITFILEVCVLSFLCVQLLKETGQFASKLHSWETLFWTLALGFYLLRFMIIGSKINKKYRNLSVLITEQINLYLHMEQKPHKKEELMLANSVLKLAADLLKELESPFKISGLCANPYLYNITKVVVLSAFSAVLTEILGFKLKLYKIKIH